MRFASATVSAIGFSHSTQPRGNGQARLLGVTCGWRRDDQQVDLKRQQLLERADRPGIGEGFAQALRRRSVRIERARQHGLASSVQRLQRSPVIELGDRTAAADANSDHRLVGPQAMRDASRKVPSRGHSRAAMRR